MPNPNNQRPIFLPLERHKQFMAYADECGYGAVDAFEHMLRTTMEIENVYFGLPTFTVCEELYKCERCVALGTEPRVRLKGAVEVQKVHDALLHAQDLGRKVLPVKIVTEIGGHSIIVQRRGKSVQLLIDGNMHKLTYQLAQDLANELMSAMCRANGL